MQETFIVQVLLRNKQNIYYFQDEFILDILVDDLSFITYVINN